MADSYLRSPTVERLESVLANVKSGAFRIPPFQREFVWVGEQRLHLLDSIRKGIPSGSLMVWRTVRALKGRPVVGPFDLGLSDPQGDGPHAYLIDGLQRTTTLFAALGLALWTRNEEPPPEVPDDRKATPDGTPWAVHYSVADDAFVFDAASATDGSVLFPLDKLLDDLGFDEWRQGRDLDRATIRRIRDLSSAFKDYLIPIVPLVTEEMSAVQTTFKRVNEGGTKMDELAMVRALTWKEDFDLADQLDELREGLGGLWGELSNDLLLKVVAAVGGEKPFDPNLEDLGAMLRPDGEQYDTALLSRAARGLERAVALYAELGVAGPGALPYGYGFVFAAEALSGQAIPNPASVDALKQWLLLQSYTGKLGNSPPHVLGALRKEAQRIGTGGGGGKAKTNKRADPLGRFSFAWARSKLAAIVLASLAPRSATTGQPMETPARRLAEAGSQLLPQLLVEGAPGVPRLPYGLQRNTMLAEPLRSVGNRVLADPDDMPRLRAIVFGQASDPGGVLESHLITPQMAAELRGREIQRFLKERTHAVLHAERAFLQRHGVDSNWLSLPQVPP